MKKQCNLCGLREDTVDLVLQKKTWCLVHGKEVKNKLPGCEHWHPDTPSIRNQKAQIVNGIKRRIQSQIHQEKKGKVGDEMKIPDPTKRFFCKDCQRDNYHYPLKSGQVDKLPKKMQGSKQRYQTYDLMECRECKALTLCIHTRIDPGPMMGDSYRKNTEFFPPLPARSRPDWIKKLQPQFRKLFGEVYQALDYSLRCVASTGIRTILDRMINDKVGDIGGFKRKVKEMQKQGIIDTNEGNRLLTVIEAGSASAHRGYDPNKRTINHMLDVAEGLLEKIYITPAKRAALEKKAKSIKQATPKRTGARRP